MKKIEVPFIIRQGDVLVMRVAAIPDDAVEAQPTGGAHVVALGESSGHRHQIPAEGNKLFRRGSAMFLEVGGRGGACALEVTTDRGAPIVPPRHEPVKLPPGMYAIRIQREWGVEQEVRNVLD